MHTNVCKNIYTTFYASPPSGNDITKEDGKILQHFSEQILFHRVRENMDSLYSSKYQLYKSFSDFRDNVVLPSDDEYQYVTEVLANVKDNMKITKLWLYALDTLQTKIENELVANKSCEDGKQLILDTMKIEMAKILAEFQINLFTKDLSIKALVMPGSTKLPKMSSVKRNAKEEEQEDKKEKRMAMNEETQNQPTSILLSRCSSNKYPVWNPALNSYECICYSDKNCLVDIASISEPDTIHPIIIIVLVVIMIGIIVRIYQSTSPIF